MADEVKKVQETGATTQAGSATPSTPAPPTSNAAANRAAGETAASTSAPRTGELDPGKSTVKGDTDYFDGKSVITDADTVVDIATIMKENNFSNVKPEKMAQLLREKGYEVEVVKMGNRGAIKFKNGDFFVDSDGDGNIGTKDQNFQSALGAVEQKFGINLSDLKSSKSLQVHQGGGGGKDDAGALGALDGLDAMDPTGQNAQMRRVFEQLDSEMVAKGYNGTQRAQDLWQSNQLSPVLQELDIDEPNLPNPSSMGLSGGVQKGLDLFNAAYSVARQRETLGL